MFNLLYQLIIVSSLAAGWQRGNSLLILTFLSPSCSLKTQHLMLNPANQSWLWQPDIHSFFFFLIVQRKEALTKQRKPESSNTV